MFKTIALSVAAVLAVSLVTILILAALKPATFRVERTASIKAPPEKIFPLINDLRSWETWSPYEKKDPAMKKTRGEAASGKGAWYAWDGNREIGKGRMEIADTAAPSRVTFKLDFERPFAGHNMVDFTLAKNGDATDVTWAFHGPNLFIGKVMSLFFNMDSMVGRDFEDGLASLKRLAEQRS